MIFDEELESEIQILQKINLKFSLNSGSVYYASNVSALYFLIVYRKNFFL